jgi:nucleotide-binding universal stress UspA family protein
VEFTGALPIRLVLVPVDASAAGWARLDIAAHLARANDADCVGVGLISSKSDHAGLARDRVVPADRTASAEHRMFVGKMTAAGVDHYWRDASVDGLAEVIAWSKLADLVVLSQVTEEVPPAFRAEAIGLECGRPILVLPSEHSGATIGLNVVIAWDGSREAVRALHDAMPLMRDAAHVTVVECETDYSRVSHHPNGQSAVAILERHGIQAFAEVNVLQSESVTDLLLRCLHDKGADLLVAGLYHHSRIREYVFGGVSRDLLRRCPVALLMSH